MTPELRKRILDHLTEPGHPLRRQCLDDLLDKNVTLCSDEVAMKVIDSYLLSNPRGFCKDGIERFRDAIKPVPKTRIVRAVLDIEYEGWQAGCLGQEFRHLLIGKAYGGGTAPHKVVNVHLVRYQTKRFTPVTDSSSSYEATISFG